MVNISKPLNSAQAQTYHKLEFTSETQRYYKQDGAVEGVWQGKLAESFGLSGTVSAEEFARLADGKHPVNEEQMVRHRFAQTTTGPDGKAVTEAVAHRAGWDATFQAPKSISLTALVGGEDRVREAHREAVTVALAELERYNTLYYSKGSKAEGIERGSTATVVGVDSDRNTVTVQKPDGQNVTYDPKRLRGVTAYREASREVAAGDRIQFTAADRKLGIMNREIAVVQEETPERITVQLPGQADRTVSFDPKRFRNFDHGYAVTSHSAQGLTTERVLANIDTDGPRSLINIGAASGGALGAGTNAITRGKEIDLKPEQLLQFRTSAPLDVTVMLQNGRQVLPGSATTTPALEQRPGSSGSSGF